MYAVDVSNGDIDMDGKELRERIRQTGLTYREAADRLGISLGGLNHQMRGERRVTRQTELLLEQLEKGCRAGPAQPCRRRRK
jgi:transcriptional regulator with XRE-family HTH domain